MFFKHNQTVKQLGYLNFQPGFLPSTKNKYSCKPLNSIFQFVAPLYVSSFKSIGWWFQILFSPRTLGKMNPFWLVSQGLVEKPPTRNMISKDEYNTFLENQQQLYPWKSLGLETHNPLLGGGFNILLLSTLHGEMIQVDSSWLIFFNRVATPNHRSESRWLATPKRWISKGPW